MTSLTFRLWTQRHEEQTSLKDVLARVTVERGHFRDITEASLQEEIAADGALESSESEDDSDEAPKQEAAANHPTPSTREELFKAKADMLGHLDAAHNDVMLALDFVSLVLSKDDKQAAASMSPALKKELPAGTLGIDLWQKMPKDRPREIQDDHIASAVRMQSLQHSADDLLEAANRLESNVRKEVKYWNEVLSITSKGWNVCRLPGRGRRLGVTFGFGEGPPEFSRRGIAALNTDANGGISLDRGIGHGRNALRVRIRRGGVEVGCSSVPPLPEAEESTLEARIRRARDSLFDEELFHEMIREGRSLTSLGITMPRDAIIFRTGKSDSGDDLELHFDLTNIADSNGDTPIAEVGALETGLVTAARLLLSQAHREHLKKRSQVPSPMSERKEEQPIIPILRPIISFVLHSSAVQKVNAYTDRVAALLRSARISHTRQVAKVSVRGIDDIVEPEDLVAKLLKPWVSNGSLRLSEKDGIAIEMQTTLAGGYGTSFKLQQLTSTASYSFDTFDELRRALDFTLASLLATALSIATKSSWKCSNREPVLRRDDGVSTSERAIWVTLNSKDGNLALGTDTKKIVWLVEGGKSDTPFLDAGKALME